jgi:predicted Zn-dependent protease with MMP-like domain
VRLGISKDKQKVLRGLYTGRKLSNKAKRQAGQAMREAYRQALDYIAKTVDRQVDSCVSADPGTYVSKNNSCTIQ